MRNFLSMLLVFSILTIPAFAQGPLDPNPNCTYGHTNNPVYTCEPPPPNFGEAGQSGLSASDDSTLTFIKTIIGDYNPFVYFLN